MIRFYTGSGAGDFSKDGQPLSDEEWQRIVTFDIDKIMTLAEKQAKGEGLPDGEIPLEAITTRIDTELLRPYVDDFVR